METVNGERNFKRHNPDDSIIRTALVIKNIQFDIAREELLGIMLSLSLPRPLALDYHVNEERKFTGLAFVNFVHPGEALIVKRAMNGMKLRLRNLTVEYKRRLPRGQREQREDGTHFGKQHQGAVERSRDWQPSGDLLFSPCPVRALKAAVGWLESSLDVFRHTPDEDELWIPPLPSSAQEIIVRFYKARGLDCVVKDENDCIRIRKIPSAQNGANLDSIPMENDRRERRSQMHLDQFAPMPHPEARQFQTSQITAVASACVGFDSVPRLQFFNDRASSTVAELCPPVERAGGRFPDLGIGMPYLGHSAIHDHAQIRPIGGIPNAARRASDKITCAPRETRSDYNVFGMNDGVADSFTANHSGLTMRPPLLSSTRIPSTWLSNLHSV